MFWAALVARDLQETTAPAGRIVFFAPEGLEFVAGFFGCILSGRVVVPTYPPNTSRVTRATARLDILIRDVAPDAFLTTPPIANRISVLASQLGWNDIPIITVRSREDGSTVATPDLDLSFINSDSPAVIQYTSGSTSDPKGVILTHRNLLNNSQGMQAFGRLSDSSVGVSWLPPYHDMGLISGLILPAYAGYHSVLSPSVRFFSRPVLWLEYIHRYRATITGGPNFAFDLCVEKVNEEDLKGLDLSSLEAVFNGAEPIRADTLTRFSKRFRHLGFNADAFSPVYGLAEGGLMSTGIPSWESPVIRNFDADLLARGIGGLPGVGSRGVSLVSCGTPLAGHTVMINHPVSMKPLEEGIIGEIYIEGPSVSRGYLNQSGEDRFRQSRFDKSSIEFQTGDLGFISEGHLFVTGRKKDLIIIRGRNVYPQDVELSAGSAHPAIDRYRVCAFSIDSNSGEHLAVVCEIKRTSLRRIDFITVTKLILEAVIRDNHISPTVVGLLKPVTVPITTSGKVRRSACRELFLTDQLKIIHRYEKESTTVPANSCRPDSEELLAVKALVRSGKSLQLLVGEKQFLAIEAYLTGTAHMILNMSPDPFVPIQSMMDSLSMVELTYRIQSDLGLNVDLFANEDLSLAELAKEIQERFGDPGSQIGDPNTGRGASAPPDIPMNPILHEMIQSGADLEEQIVTVFLRLPPHDSINQVRSLLSQVLSRHSSFYLRRHPLKNCWRFVEGVGPNLLLFRVLGRESVDLKERGMLKTKLEAIISAPFDLFVGPLVRAVYISPGVGQRSMLALSFSQSVVDALSLRFLATDLERAWKDPVLQSVGISVSPDRSAIEWAFHLEKYAQSKLLRKQSAYWTDLGQQITSSFVPHQSGVKKFCAKALDPATSVRTQTGRLQLSLSGRLVERFPTLRQQHDVFLGTLVMAWCSLAETGTVAVTLETHGRDEMRRSGITGLLIGNLTERFPAVFEVGVSDSLEDTASRLTKVINRTPQRGIGFGLLRHLCADPVIHKMFSEFPMPLLRFVYRGKLDEDFRESDTFKVLNTGVLRPKSGSRQPREDSEFIVFVRREADIFSWTVEVNPGTRAHWKFPLETELSSRMEIMLCEAFLEQG